MKNAKPQKPHANFLYRHQIFLNALNFSKHNIEQPLWAFRSFRKTGPKWVKFSIPKSNPYRIIFLYVDYFTKKLRRVGSLRAQWHGWMYIVLLIWRGYDWKKNGVWRTHYNFRSPQNAYGRIHCCIGKIKPRN